MDLNKNKTYYSPAAMQNTQRGPESNKFGERGVAPLGLERGNSATVITGDVHDQNSKKIEIPREIAQELHNPFREKHTPPKARHCASASNTNSAHTTYNTIGSKRTH